MRYHSRDQQTAANQNEVTISVEGGFALQSLERLAGSRDGAVPQSREPELDFEAECPVVCHDPPDQGDQAVPVLGWVHWGRCEWRTDSARDR